MGKSLVVLVCGDREWMKRRTIKKRLAQLPIHAIIVHGDCRGADKLAGEVARELLFTEVIFPANWGRFGRGAGPIQNKMMLERMQPDLVLAFHSNLEKSKGTKNTVALAIKAGIEVEVLPKEAGR